MLLEEVGAAGQQRLSEARVLIIGAGGLGSPAALYLAAAGVGTLGIADFDVVEEHNLQRQLLHPTANLGRPKVESAIETLRGINPLVAYVAHAEGITAANAVAIFRQYDVVLDGTDNFSARYLNNDAAFFAQRPLVHGSVFKFEGQVGVFDPHGGGPCYRCLFPEPPAQGSVPGCGEAGVIGALCGVIGSLQALEVIKLITKTEGTLRGKLLTYHSLTHQMTTFALPRAPECSLCGANRTITEIVESRYHPTGPHPTAHSMKENEYPLEITVSEANALLISQPDGALLIDVREPHELEICRVAIAQHIPMREIPEQIADLPRDRQLLIMCHHGGRSRRVTDYLRAEGLGNVTNVDGGVDGWAVEIDPTMARY